MRHFGKKGHVLSFRGPSAGDHGTHVAAIVGAYCGDRDKCGVAPGAQLVSIKIGDARLGTMESGAALARALIAAKRCGCDVLNLSYGEAASLPDAGAFAAKATQLVRDTEPGAIFVSSAGNNGPAHFRRPTTYVEGSHFLKKKTKF